MDSEEFVRARKKLGKTQKEMANLLGTSVKAVRSYEQGWRDVSTHVERQVFFLLSRTNKTPMKPCWVTKKCPPERKTKCPAWEFQAGKLCWFINGTFCQGVHQVNWKEKMNLCRNCSVLTPLIE